jgi:putative endopeptidase
MMKPMFATLLLVLPLAAFAEEPPHGVDPGKIDRTATACQNLYQFANGTWLANNPIPSDRSSWGAGSELQEQNYRVLHEILDAAAADRTAAPGSARAKVGEFYRVGMDERRIESDGAAPVAEELARIGAIRDSPSLAREIGHLHREGNGAAFILSVVQDFKNSIQNIGQLYQGGLGLPDRDYYVSDDARMKEIRAKYLAHVGKMLELAGEAPAAAASHAQTVLDFETRLARKSMTPVEQRDPDAIYHKMPLAKLEALAPGFSWKAYFAEIGLAEPGEINVSQPEFFREIGAMAKQVPRNDWKTYLRWNAIRAAAPFLSSAFVTENFHFFGQTLNGQKELRPRWKRVLETVDGELGEALGQLYVERAFPPEAKVKALEMVANLRAALKDRLQAIDWIGEKTREQALRKLDAIRVKVGYPDTWRDYSKLAVDRGTYLANVEQAEAFDTRRNLDKIGRPLDRAEWGITTPTVDAYYNPSLNEIVFPAGILQPPFFDPKADDASNYGGIGTVIGHELTHGFDDQGRRFDAQGNLKDWWTPEDVKNFAERAAFVEKQYSDYVAVDDLHVNGKLTLGENIADIGGVKIAFVALRKSLAGKPEPEKLDGFTADQRFFLSYAQAWRRNSTPEALRLLVATNPHSPSFLRVRGPVADAPEFGRAFDCGDQSAKASAQIW